MKHKTIFIILLLVPLLASCKNSDMQIIDTTEKESATNSPALSSESTTPPSAAESVSTTAELMPVSPADIPPKYVFTADFTGDGQDDTVEVYFYTLRAESA